MTPTSVTVKRYYLLLLYSKVYSANLWCVRCPAIRLSYDRKPCISPRSLQTEEYMDYLAKGPGQDGKRDAAMGKVLTELKK